MAYFLQPIKDRLCLVDEEDESQLAESNFVLIFICNTMSCMVIPGAINLLLALVEADWNHISV